MREDVFVDSATRAVLGIDAYVSWLTPGSPAGERLAGALTLFGAAESGAWQSDLDRSRQTEAWADDHAEELDTLENGLANLPDTERALRRLRVGETLDESDLFAIKRFLFYARVCLVAAVDLVDRDPDASRWHERAAELMEEIHPEKRRSSRFHLASALDEELARARKALRNLKRRERELREDIEAAVLDVYDGRFDIRGHFRPAASCEDQALRDDDRLVDAAGAWQLADPALDDLRDEREQAEAAVTAGESRAREALTEVLSDEERWLRRVELTLAEIDLQLAKSRLRERVSGSWPRWSDDAHTRVVGGTEFGVLRMLEDTDEAVQPVDVDLGEEPTVVSGPNMGGKSALLRLVGLCQWAAQHALPVPAEAYTFAPVAALVYVGSEEPLAEQNIEGLSSFGREVRRLVSWWDRGEGPRLWLLDEVGRGTHPEEGARIALDIIDRLSEKGDRCVAATHFPAVANMEGARKLRIAGLTDPGLLDQLLRGADDEAGGGVDALQSALRAAMDYRPMPIDEHDVPRDARVVARALGLSLDEE